MGSANDLIKSSRKTRNWLLFFIFLAGISFRLYGLRWGFPHYFHPDERQVMFRVSDLSWKRSESSLFCIWITSYLFIKGNAVHC